MTTAITTIDYSDQALLQTLKDTVAKGANASEFAMFLEVCKSSGLNPFRKEIWFVKDQRTQAVQMMTGINGYWSIANSHPEFDGAETGMINSDGEWVKSVSGNDFIGAWCRVYRKDRRMPLEAEAMLSDYRKGFGLWNSAPRIMIKKVAESIALRKAFPQQMNGLYTQEEMPANFSNEQEPVTPIAKPELTAVVVDPLTGEIMPNAKLRFAERPALATEAPSVVVADHPAKAVDNEAKVEEKPKKVTNKIRDLETFYDVNGLMPEQREAAVKYLTINEAKEIMPGVYRSAIKLKKLTSCIVEKEPYVEAVTPNI